MGEITVLGGGVCGLATAIMLARDGHEVTVLERDSQPPDALDEAWSSWTRPGVAQFRQPHFLHSRVRHVLERELPDVCEALLAAKAAVVDPLDRLPPGIADRGPRPGDERLVAVTARRTTTEHVFASAAENEPGVQVRRGVEVAGLTARRNGGVPHVTGVRMRAGEELASDLVVDAMGRNSKLPRWLQEHGVAVHEEAEECGFLYYTRFFGSRDGSCPSPRTPFLATPIGSFTIITLPADGDTWSVTIYAASDDRPLTQLKHVDRFTSLVAACPLQAHWLEGEPLSDVLPMGGVLDRYRRLRLPGVALVADSWACTNPSLARGIALGLEHAARLRDTVRAHLDDASALAEAWDAVTEGEFTPWYRATVATDRARLAEIERLRTGAEAPAPPSDPLARARVRLPVAATRDPDVFRAFTEIVACLTLPAEIFARPGFADRVLELTDGDVGAPPPGPTRAELLQLLAG